MESKPEEQIKPEIEEWILPNTFIDIMVILTPVAFLAIILGQTGVFLDFLLNSQYLYIKDVKQKPTSKSFPNLKNWLSRLISFVKNPQSNHSKIKSLNPIEIWKDGSILCTAVNIVVPGACGDPRSHRMQPPIHGQQLVFEYLNIEPIFSPEDLFEKTLTLNQMRKFTNYLNKVQKIITETTKNSENLKYSTDYVARGMGLVVAEQNKKTVFYIYPIPKRIQTICDIDIYIKGPCGNNGKITVPSILHNNKKIQPPTNYNRALYMTSKVNSISPTIQGSSFLRKLSLAKDNYSEIDIRAKVTKTRAKISYIPEKTGIYEISLMTKGCHIVGSPYSVAVEIATNSNYKTYSSESEDEKENKYNKKPKKNGSKYILLDTKTLSKENGTLIRIDDKFSNLNNNKEILLNSFKENDKIKSNNYENITKYDPTSDLIEETEFIKKSGSSNLQDSNDLQIIIRPDPTLISNYKVQDQIMNSQDYEKSFSTTEKPKQKLYFKFNRDTKEKKNNEKGCTVNNLIKLFSPNDKNETDNHPDLLECHMIKNETNLKLLTKLGAISKDFNENQCFLKLNLNEFIKKNIAPFPENYDKGFVKKQKEFWLNQTQHSNITISKDNEIKSEIIINKGIVQNKCQLFENNNNNISNIYKAENVPKFITKSLNVKIVNKVDDKEINKSIDEEIIKIPTIKERKLKLKKAFNKSLKISGETSFKETPIKKLNNNKFILNNTNIELNNNNCEMNKDDDNQSKMLLNRKSSNFENAKLYFQTLENSSEISNNSTTLENNSNGKVIFKKSVSNPETLLNYKTDSKVSKSKSDPSISSTKLKIQQKLSDRFLVEDLYQDILGDKTRFFGVPNQGAVAASLASLNNNNQNNCNNQYEFDEEYPNLECFNKPKINNTDENKNIPGYYTEYPHPPKKHKWKYTEKNQKSEDIIPGRILFNSH